MSRDIIHYKPSFCSGCMYCMVVCSTFHDGAAGLTGARLRIQRHEGHALTRMDEKSELIFDRICCRHCDKPACIPACPAQAISKDPDTGIVLIDTSMCTGCGDCLTACPFEAIFRHPSLNRILKCDLCGGQPQCVLF